MYNIIVGTKKFDGRGVWFTPKHAAGWYEHSAVARTFYFTQSF